MSQDNFTPITTGAAITSSGMNTVLGQLDAAIKKNNYAATAAPTTGDDTGDGYTVGSRWFDVTNDRAYVALDVTLGAAVWKEITVPATFAAISVSTSVNNTGFEATFTGASSASVGPQLGLLTNDGAAVASNDRLGQIQFGGHNGSSVVNGGIIIFRATETWSGSARGNKMEFYTTPNTTTAAALALTIDQNADLVAAGNVKIASGKTLQVNNTQVVSARNTGWTAPTATQSKAGFGNGATSTQIEQTLSAVVNALITHGLLGT